MSANMVAWKMVRERQRYKLKVCGLTLYDIFSRVGHCRWAFQRLTQECSLRECVLLVFCGSVATTILLYVGHNHLASEQCYSFSCWLGSVSPHSQGSCWNATLYSLRSSERIRRSSNSTVEHNGFGNLTEG